MPVNLLSDEKSLYLERLLTYHFQLPSLSHIGTISEDIILIIPIA